MTVEELHVILDDEKFKLSLQELKDVIYQLKNDVFGKSLGYIDSRDSKSFYHYGFYVGQENAYYIVLDLLDHLK